MSTQSVGHALQMQLLGTPQISLGQAPLTFTRRSSLALLAYLAVTGESHSREALAGLLTGDATPARASMHLRNALADLNRQIGDYLEITRHTVALNPLQPYWLDVRVFDAALAEAERGQNPRHLQPGVEVYGGEFLAGFSLRAAPDFEHWLLLERESLHQRAVQALQTLLNYTIEHDEPATAIGIAQRLLHLDPWHEATHQQLILLLARSGQRGAALAHYETFQRRLAVDLQTEPLEATTALYQRLRSEPLAPRHNLLPAPTPFIGRVTEQGILLRQLADPTCRLITLVGLAGVGKSRLALQAAKQYLGPTSFTAAPPFPDGIYVVDLTSVTPNAARDGNVIAATARAIAAAITATVGLTLAGAPDPTMPLLTRLRSQRMLLVLDNFEHLLGGIQFLTDLLMHAPLVKLLVTSRVRLKVREEWSLPLDGLSLPDSPDAVEQSDAGRLFLQEATQVQLNAPLSAADYPHIVRICQVTQGLPLALALAASWLPTITCAALADELTANLDLLTASSSQTPTRHDSIRALLVWSWQRLSTDEQQALRRLAVFRDGFDREAARTVAGVDLAGLRALQDNALLTVSPSGRYRLHELVRQFAARRLLAQAQESAQTRTRHAAYYTAFIQRYNAGFQAREVLHIIQTEMQNVRAAWEWAALRGDVSMLAHLRQGLALWYSASEPAEAPYMAHQVTLGGLLTEQASLLIKQRQYDRALPLLQEAQALAQATGNRELAARSAFHRAEIAWDQGDMPAAQVLFEQALGLARGQQNLGNDRPASSVRDEADR